MDTLKEETRGRRSWDRESNLSKCQWTQSSIKKNKCQCFMFVVLCFFVVFFKIKAMWFESSLSPWCVFAVALLLCCVPC